MTLSWRPFASNMNYLIKLRLTELIGLLAVLLVTENAHGGVGLGDHGQLERARETLVSGGIVVLQGDLELDGLDEFPELALLLGTSDGDLLAGREGHKFLTIRC
jgi:hypothetical protein